MKNNLLSIFILLSLILAYQCSPSNEQQLLDEFNKRTIVECAEYYQEIRAKINFADNLFSKTIVPKLDTCKFRDLQKVKNIVENTPAYDEVNTLYINKCDTILKYAEDRLWRYADNQKMFLIDTIIPIIINDCRNKKPMNKTLAEVISDYKGVFGKIFDSDDDFKEEWDEKITHEICQAWIDSISCLKNYKEQVNQAYKKYYDDNCPDEIKILDAPTTIRVDLTMPKEIVAAWVKNEQDKTWDKAKGFAMDFVESAVEELISGRGRGKFGGKSKSSPGGRKNTGSKNSKSKPSGNNQKSNGIDVGEIISDAKDVFEETWQNMNDDEKLTYLLSEHLLEKIVFGIANDYFLFFDNQTNTILNQLLGNYKPRQTYLPDALLSNDNETKFAQQQITNNQIVNQNTESTKIINNPRVKNAPNKMRVSISKITITDSYTAIECVVDNTKGSYSYIAIDDKTYIIVNGNYIQLTDTDGIGVSPEKTAIKKGVKTTFILYFPSIKKDTKVIDLIESGKNGWKFYGIKLN